MLSGGPSFDKVAFVRCLGGRLIGLRTGNRRTRKDWEGFAVSFSRAVDDFAGRPVVCADLRDLTTLDDEAYDLLTERMRQYNAKLLRAALIVSPLSPAGLRIESALREANNAARRVCTDPFAARAWLSSCLDAGERAALEVFLASRGMGFSGGAAVSSPGRKLG
jgi:hypothetical protein